MTGEYISKIWLLQNVPVDEDAEAAHIIEAAPVVEFDPDEPPQYGRCRNCKHFNGGAGDFAAMCYYWPGFVHGDDWCSNYGRRET